MPLWKRILFWTLLALVPVVTVELVLRVALRFQVIFDEVCDRFDEGPAASPIYRWRWVGARQDREGPMPYNYDEYDEWLGWKTAPDMRHFYTRNRQWVINTNSNGLRGPEEHAYRKTSGEYRIAVIGDSFTFGDGVHDALSYPAVLESLLPNTEVLNFGVHGYGHDQMFLQLKDVVSQYELDMIVLGYVDGDVHRNGMSFRDFSKPYFDLENGELVLQNVPVPEPEWFLETEVCRPKLLDFFQMMRGRSWDYRPITAALLRAIKEEIVQQKAVPVFFHILGQVPQPEFEEGDLRMEKEFRKVCQDLGVLALYSRPGIAAGVARGEPYANEDHWNAPGYRTLAEELAKGIKNAGLLPR